MESFIHLKSKFGGNGEYNDHAHHKEHKGSLSRGCCCCSSLGVCCYCPLGGSGYPDSGFPQQVGFVGGYFPLVLGYYCFSFFLSFWHYSTDGPDFPYSTVQKYEIVEWERVEQS
jgi:hypothetical protein